MRNVSESGDDSIFAHAGVGLIGRPMLLCVFKVLCALEHRHVTLSGVTA